MQEIYEKIFLCVIFSIVQVTAYKAAVVEYSPVGIYGPDTAIDIIRKNLNEYQNIVSSLVGNGVDLIVFPEYGITSLQVPADRTRAKEFLQVVPEIDSEYVACSSDNNDQSHMVARSLSCMAKQLSSYLIANVGEIRACDPSDSFCPTDGVYHYNIDVVFDRSGHLIAKYRKKNLYGEAAMDRPRETDLTTFDTDFGVKFGVIVCFDMMHREPTIDLYEGLNINNFIVSTAWVDELPFLTAPQIQSGLARALNATFIVSGYHYPRAGQLGSGIFERVKAQNYVFDATSGTTVLLSAVGVSSSCVPTIKLPISSKVKAQPEHFILQEDLSKYSHMSVNIDSGKASLCHNTTCCSISFTTRMPHGNVMYKLLAYDGIRFVGGGRFSLYIETCAFVACASDSIDSCASLPSGFVTADFDSVELYGNFTAAYPMPSVINKSMQLYNPGSLENTRIDDKIHSLRSVQPLEDLLTFALYARRYDLD